jgi:hypothetical protein
MPLLFIYVMFGFDCSRMYSWEASTWRLISGC